MHPISRGRSTCVAGVVVLVAAAGLQAHAEAQAPPPPPAPTVLQREAPPAQPPMVGPPIQRIESASALSAEAFGAITGVRELSDGRVLVNDGTRRRLHMMDTTLATTRVVLDSLSEVAHSYGVRAGALIPARGDTTFFVDPAALAVVVLGPDAEMVRVRSVWRAQDVNTFSNTTGAFGFPAVDARGRVVYRIPATPAPPAVRPPANVPYFPPQPDSAFLVAVDPDTRRVDTLGVVRIPKVDQRIRQSVDGRFTLESTVNPLPVSDHWAVLPDGTVAIVRSSDYRVEFLQPDGSRRISGRIPYEWQRLSDDARDALVDSTRTALQRSAANDYVSAMIRWTNGYGRPFPPGFEVPEGYVPPAGFARDWILPPGVSFPGNYVYACEPGQEPPAAFSMMAGGGTMVMQGGGGAIQVQGAAPAGAVQMQAGPPPGAVVIQRDGAPPAAPAGGAPATGTPAPGGAPAGMCVPAPPVMSGGAVPAPPTMRNVAVIAASELPDYRPALMSGAQGAIRADMDGNLWVRTVLPRAIPGGPVYDIVSPEGELTRRIQLPPGYTLVGFGRDGVVYLSMRDPSGVRLARVRLRQDD